MLTQTRNDVSIVVQQPIGAPVDVVVGDGSHYAGRCGGHVVHPNTGQVLMIVDLHVPLPLGSTGVFTASTLVDLSSVRPMHGGPVVEVQG